MNMVAHDFESRDVAYWMDHFYPIYIQGGISIVHPITIAIYGMLVSK